ncbi:hypothetical protein MTR67_006764 [Solanum verrucosum]|uniref:Uncharacterized protein n=1 Tax=Solanum verrucosum TaxID=315347 RepID=A0AAF0PYF1_SOLVR|nr:hypothetical protein MTR67_006764 [Solanum verrucosum]
MMVIYALTSGVAGYTSTSFYCQLEGTNWLIKHKLLARKRAQTTRFKSSIEITIVELEKKENLFVAHYCNSSYAYKNNIQKMDL